MSKSAPHCEQSFVEDSEPERVVIRGKMTPASRAPLNLGVIDIHDSDSASGSSLADGQFLPSKGELGNGKTPIPLSRIGVNPESDIDTPMIPRTLDATRFAFGPGKATQKPPTAPPSRLPSRSNTLQDTLPQVEALDKPARLKKPALRLTAMYSDKDIEAVICCIACGVPWTARKSSAQKSDHMRKCCKKAKYTQDTIDALLHKAIRNTSKIEEPLRPTTAPTLLAVIQPPEKKKRGRVAQVKSTVSDVRETREEIRSRAMQFLQVEDSPEPPEANPREGVFPATQVFGKSRLGAAKATKSLFSADDDSAAEAESPPATQQFGQSNLGAGRPKRSLFAADNSSGSDSGSKSKGSPSRKKARGKRASPSSGSTDCEAEALVPALAAVSIHDRPRVGRPKSKSPKRPKKVKPTSVKAVYGVAWEEQLRGKIRENEDVHTRILRFEPILLADILNLLDGGANHDAALAKHVSAFLDKEGIHVATDLKWGKKKKKATDK